MNLYKISQTENEGYDTYDSAVVVANNIEDAKTIHPEFARGLKPLDELWEVEKRQNWESCWCKSPDAVTVELIGTAAPGIKPNTVIVASFNAG